jgi:DNA-binding transcriptional LysR family regulator
MSRLFPSISIEQVGAFVQLAESGSLSAAARVLNLSAEGMRNRLVALEERVGVELYEKEMRRRGLVTLTPAGRLFLRKAVQFLEGAQTLTQLFEPGRRQQDLLIAASQYLTYYVLIDVVRIFRLEFPFINVRLLTRTEQQILTSIQSGSEVSMGICAPLDFPADVVCDSWFSLNWFLVAPHGHRLLAASSVSLTDIVGEPLILFEPGSTGRQHVLEAFSRCALTPHIVMEATSTQIVVRMVEAGLGVAVVPLLPSGAVTRGVNVGYVPLSDDVRSIDTCILSRKGCPADIASEKFQAFLRSHTP